ncbi:hypothetical protein L2W42_19195 [Rhizobium gallicum]|nr:hypothetical protein [Rhizobium gallicum]ULJ71887.1 hypothetical protein L2W42_19195 [Rhizobium gallicum]
MFLLRVNLARSNLRHQIVLRGCDELLLHQIQDLHRRHDVGDRAVDLQGCRLVARRLADRDGLDEITHDRHQPLLGVFVGIVAGEEEQLADSNLDVGRIELRLQLRDLLLKILRRRFGAGEFQHQLLPRYLQFIELVVQDGKAWPAFSMAVVDLLHQALLGCLDRRKLGVQRIFAGRRTLQHADFMRDHHLRNPVEDIERVEGDGDAVQHPFLQVLALDGFGVAAAFAVKLVDRQPLAMVGAAIAVLAGDCVRASAFRAFQHAAQQIFRALRRIQPVTLPEIKQITDLLLPALHALPQFVRDNAHGRYITQHPLVCIR